MLACLSTLGTSQVRLAFISWISQRFKTRCFLIFFVVISSGFIVSTRNLLNVSLYLSYKCLRAWPKSSVSFEFEHNIPAEILCKRAIVLYVCVLHDLFSRVISILTPCELMQVLCFERVHMLLFFFTVPFGLKTACPISRKTHVGDCEVKFTLYICS